MNDLITNLIDVITTAREDWEGEQSAGITLCCVTQCLESHTSFAKIGDCLLTKGIPQIGLNTVQAESGQTFAS